VQVVAANVFVGHISSETRGLCRILYSLCSTVVEFMYCQGCRMEPLHYTLVHLLYDCVVSSVA